jgi:hypothetical protein
MKPSWNDAPEWAQWLAQDKNGLWNWFEIEPYPYIETWCFEYSHGTKSYKAASNKSPRHINKDWQSTLEKRPQTDMKG